MIKRAVDLALAPVLLLLSVPLWLVAAIAIRVDSPGPVILRQERVGWKGKPFRVFKFRSMAHDAEDRIDELARLNEADGPCFRITNDPRLTRVGGWLRRLSVDELPQLINVIKGEMSLVGPRPTVPREVGAYPAWARRRFQVPPGLTGLRQVSGRALLSFADGVGLDVFYAEHWSLGLDLRILIRTFPAILSGKGAR